MADQAEQHADYERPCADCARLTGFPGSWREHRLAHHGPALVKNSQDGARVDHAEDANGADNG